jgi:hypothetical protein
VKSEQERFMAMVSPEPNSGCWLWTGNVDPGGYARFHSAINRSERAHRAAYRFFRGPIADGKQVDHLCRVRSCVNPDHLEAVTQLENVRRGMSGTTNRNKTHCPSGHPYSGDNLYVQPDGGRACRTCNRRAVAKAKQKRLMSEQHAEAAE